MSIVSFPRNHQKVVVIGAGVAGLSTSIRLALAGFQVQVFDSASGPGGKLSQFWLEGFRFDRGPSLFTMPQWVDELFYLAGEDPRKFFNYRRLDPITKYFFADGSCLRAWADRERFVEECCEILGESSAAIHAYLDESARKYRITAPYFIESSLHRWRTYWNRSLPAALMALPTLGIFKSMNRLHCERFASSRTVQLFNRYATYNGSDPYQAPATLTLIPHVEYNIGAFLPECGMFQIAESLYNLARRLGVEFHFNQPVQRIIALKRKVEGIELTDRTVPADIVVSNVDVFTTYRRLLPGIEAPERILKQPRSSSALIFYWGIRSIFKELEVHNIFFSSDYEREFKAIFRQNTIPDDLTIYVNITSKLVTTDAPPGCENWFVMINVPPNTGQDWDPLIQQARFNIIKHLNNQLGVNLECLITCEALFDPRTIESQTGSWQGSLYGSSSNSRWAAFLRHANRSARVRGLYFCGGSVHPGGGIPLCLQSGKIVAQLIQEKYR